MSIATNAVFLSYASQDTEAARRICETLRAAGVEVWFDQSELRGGDAWDAKIRKQIRDCALFLPVISANTESRLEGYFRLEWKLAEDRSHLMARGKAFVVPVTIDDTPERDAHVPDSFLAVQWTRLPGGQTSTAFCERVKILTDADPGPRCSRGPGSFRKRLTRHCDACRRIGWRGRAMSRVRWKSSSRFRPASAMGWFIIRSPTCT